MIYLFTSVSERFVQYIHTRACNSQNKCLSLLSLKVLYYPNFYGAKSGDNCSCKRDTQADDFLLDTYIKFLVYAVFTRPACISVHL